MEPNSFQKMKVELAAQVFSKTVVCDMRSCMIDGTLSLEANDTVEFINFMDSLSDLFNSFLKAVKILTEFSENSESDLKELHRAKRFGF